MTMFAASEQQLSLELDSSAEGSPVRTCRVSAHVLACKVLAAAFGSSSSASSASYGLSGSWSRTWRAALRSGWTLSCADWNSSAMLAYRFRLRQAMSVPRTGVPESLSLPTLTAKANLLSPYMARWKRHRAQRAMMPTLCSRDAKGIGPKHTQGGQDLPRTLGGNLNADWCRWFMGFPRGWLAVLDVSKSGCSATQLSRSARKSSGG